MKQSIFLLAVMLLLLSLSACGQRAEAEASTWQERYDLGMRYLGMGSYEEAILTFNAAIELDSTRAAAYVGRGDAYMLSGASEEDLTAAQADYALAIELDETDAAAYLGLANVYAQQGDRGNALEILQAALKKTEGSRTIRDTIEALQSEVFDAYRELLDVLYYGKSSDWKFANAEYEELVKGSISYLWYAPYAELTLSEMGYMLLDLDGNGVPELIASAIADNWGSGDGFIYDLYTYHAGKVVRLASSQERDRYYLCSDRTLRNEWSSGADSSGQSRYRIGGDPTGLEEIGSVDLSTVPLELTSLSAYQPLTSGGGYIAANDTGTTEPSTDAVLMPVLPSLANRQYSVSTIGHPWRSASIGLARSYTVPR